MAMPKTGMFNKISSLQPCDQVRALSIGAMGRVCAWPCDHVRAFSIVAMGRVSTWPCDHVRALSIVAMGRVSPWPCDHVRALSVVAMGCVCAWGWCDYDRFAHTSTHLFAVWRLRVASQCLVVLFKSEGTCKAGPPGGPVHQHPVCLAFYHSCQVAGPQSPHDGEMTGADGRRSVTVTIYTRWCQWMHKGALHTFSRRTMTRNTMLCLTQYITINITY